MRTPSRIIIVDDHPARSADLCSALAAQPDLTLSASVTCASCTFGAVSRQQPDLVLLSLSMPDHRVLDLVKDLRVLHAGLKLLVVSSQDQELETALVLRAGAHGCVAACSSIPIKLDAMRQVLAGRHCFTSPGAGAFPSSVSPIHWAGAAVAL
ncbi:response regulator [Prosthecobacter sp.]|uniref:response regulator n=1 Tax=Prosthecobacter sp. TaxID=1965333 RepID=UPI00378362C8